MLLFGAIGLIFVTTLAATVSHVTGIATFPKAFARITLFFVALFTLAWVTSPFRTKMVLDKEDYYGEYIINRKYFPGKQADWQYNTFRFEIKENDSIYFYVTDQSKILEVFRGKIRTTDPRNYSSCRLIIDMEKPTHHILSDNPTTYRDVWNFYLVFESPKFHNVFFTKGEWEPID